ncbi:MAG: PIN domain-containing protein [Planctomycetota bacterium]
MDGYLLDTNILEYWFNENRAEHTAVIARIAALPDDAPLFVSPVTIGEMEYGYRTQSPSDESREAEFRAFVLAKVPAVLPIDRHTTEPYGQLRAAIFDQYAPGDLRAKKKRPCQLTDHATATTLGIDENDLWIAAQAIQYNLILVTNDGLAKIRAVLRQVAPALRDLENWTVSTC